MTPVVAVPPRAAGSLPEMLSIHAIAEMFDVMPATITTWVRGGRFPAPGVRIGNKKFWTADQLARLIDADRGGEAE